MTGFAIKVSFSEMLPKRPLFDDKFYAMRFLCMWSFHTIIYILQSSLLPYNCVPLLISKYPYAGL